jgi:hypothetical protein
MAGLRTDRTKEFLRPFFKAGVAKDLVSPTAIQGG